jgi:hypothetical protein
MGGCCFGVESEEGRTVKGDGKGGEGQILSKYFIYKYENRKMKLVKII